MLVIALSLLLVLPGTVSAEPIEHRLLRTIQTGTLQQLELPEVIRYSKGEEADFLGHVLARSALVVLGKDEGFPDWPIERLLDRTLNQLQRRSHAYHLPPEMPAGFGGEDLVFTLVHAMVMGEPTRSGCRRSTRRCCTASAPSSSSTSSRLRRGRAMRSLRLIA